MITTTTIDRVRALLSGAYRTQHTEEALQAILLACLNLSDEVFEQAVRQHLADTGLDRDGQPLGTWFPKPAQILRHAEEIEQQRRRASLTVYQSTQQELVQPDQEEDQVELHLPDEQCRQYGLSPTVRARRSRCPHCADSGMARFYHDRKEHRRVWLAPEYLDLPDALRSRLDSASAVCDCRVGQQRPERAWMTTIRYYETPAPFGRGPGRGGTLEDSPPGGRRGQGVAPGVAAEACRAGWVGPLSARQWARLVCGMDGRAPPRP